MKKTLLASDKDTATTDELAITLKHTQGWENALTDSSKEKWEIHRLWSSDNW